MLHPGWGTKKDGKLEQEAREKNNAVVSPLRSSRHLPPPGLIFDKNRRREEKLAVGGINKGRRGEWSGVSVSESGPLSFLSFFSGEGGSSSSTSTRADPIQNVVAAAVASDEKRAYKKPSPHPEKMIEARP